MGRHTWRRENNNNQQNNLVLYAIRCCGKIFCADCSENSTPLPSEQLYNPVRVCSDCYTRLHHHHHTNSCPCNARHQYAKAENEMDPSEVIPSQSATCQRSRKLPPAVTKDTCCDNLLQAAHQKTQPSVAAATANWGDGSEKPNEREKAEERQSVRGWRDSPLHRLLISIT